jgi:alpha-D-ribose 1-methylphosphonate 5-triphosphate synthase subunit PhnH
MTDTLLPGFADPVTDAQLCFRSVLDAMARPGTVHRIGGIEPPAPLCAAAGAALLTLVDHETPLWLEPAAEQARGWIAFHCGSPFVASSRAAFAMALTLPNLATLSVGTYEMPETSATLILQVTSLTPGLTPGLTLGRRYRLSGPGVRTSAMLSAEGLSDDFAAIWQRNQTLFPCGIDVILCAGDRLAALPRTVLIEEA